ncbi:hypothetical protein CR492_20060 [Methylocella silvestris]|uniref:Uncharacterized protein n=1 Tax=Methylocella silvestris TaxID=199596 RepID=A0A2J7TBR1_METSI|nr:hypothetical protein CR492_20060 [Methylocella silvestris]
MARSTAAQLVADVGDDQRDEGCHGESGWRKVAQIRWAEGYHRKLLAFMLAFHAQVFILSIYFNWMLT